MYVKINMMRKNTFWFTLVELLVIVVILSILSTVWFVSYTQYLQWARDSSRIQQVTGIFDAIQLFSTRTKIPLPRKSIQIRYWSNLIWYQGDIDLSVLERIEYSEWGKDPKTLDFFSYMVSSDRKSSQVLTYFEDSATLDSQINRIGFLKPETANAVFEEDVNFADLFTVDYTILYPFVYGFELWVLLDSEFNAPINKNIFLENTTLNLLTSTGTYKSYISNTDIISWSWDAFIGIIPRTDCAKIQNLLWGIPDGIYKINPSGVKPINTYCEMDIDFGWWTLVWRTTPWSSEEFGWLSEYGNVFDNTSPYSLWEDIKDIRFRELLFATYDTAKNINSAVKLEIDDIFFSSNIGIADDTTVGNINSCEMVLTWWLVDPCLDANTWNQPAFTQWWKFALEDTFWTGFNGSFSGALRNNGYSGATNLWSWIWNSFDGKQWMIFVR